MTIYLDVLFLVNSYITAFLLFSTRYLSQQHTSSKRVFLASVFGGLLSLLFALRIAALFLWMVRIAGGAVLLILAFGTRNIFRTGISFLAVNLVYGGFLLLLKQSDFSGPIVRNGYLYYPVSAYFLCVATMVIYLFLWLYARIHFKTVSEQQLITLELKGEYETIRLPVLLDTGHHLQDVMSGLPVVICEAAALRRYWRDSDFTALLSMRPEELSEPLRKKFSLVYVESVGGSSALPAVRIDHCRICSPGKCTDRSVVLALSNKTLSGGQFQAIAGIEL